MSAPPAMATDASPRRVGGRARSGARGITLIELMAVVTIIGIFVVLASPSMSGALADRTVAAGANEIAALFRVARARAASTGAAHLVRVTGSSALTFELRAAAATAAPGQVASCLTPTWTAAATDSQLLSSFDFSTDSNFKGSNLLALPGTALAAGDYCFTPGGITWWKTAGVWARPTGGANIDIVVERLDAGVAAGLIRHVRMGTTGIARVEVDP